MFKLDLLHESKINESPLFGNIDKDFIISKTDPDGSWCLPYARGSVGIFYNKNIVKDGINSWDDLRARLAPSDRKCFAFFHPLMPNEPLIFVEVALNNNMPKTIDEIEELMANAA